MLEETSGDRPGSLQSSSRRALLHPCVRTSLLFAERLERPTSTTPYERAILLGIWQVWVVLVFGALVYTYHPFSRLILLESSPRPGIYLISLITSLSYPLRRNHPVMMPSCRDAYLARGLPYISPVGPRRDG